MKKEPEILFEWYVPQEMREYEARNNLRRWLRIISITIIAGIIFEACLLVPIVLILKKCGPEYERNIPDFLRIFIFAIPAMMVMPAIAIVWEQIDLRWSHRWAKAPYQITKDSLITNPNNVHPIRWSQAMFIGVSPHSTLKGYFYLEIFHNKIKKRIPLPKSDLTDKIIEFALRNSKLEKDDSLITPISLTLKQKLSIYCITGLFILTFSGLFYCMRNLPNAKDVFPVTFLIWIYSSFFFGPGTLGMLLFHRKLYFRRHDLRKTAIRYNSIPYLIILTIFFIYLFSGFFLETFSKLQ